MKDAVNDHLIVKLLYLVAFVTNEKFNILKHILQKGLKG